MLTDLVAIGLPSQELRGASDSARCLEAWDPPSESSGALPFCHPGAQAAAAPGKTGAWVLAPSWHTSLQL